MAPPGSGKPGTPCVRMQAAKASAPACLAGEALRELTFAMPGLLGPPEHDAARSARFAGANAHASGRAMVRIGGTLRSHARHRGPTAGPL